MRIVANVTEGMYVTENTSDVVRIHGGQTGPGGYILQDCNSDTLTVRFIILFGFAFFVQCFIIYMILAGRYVYRRHRLVVPDEVRHRDVLAMVHINPR